MTQPTRRIVIDTSVVVKRFLHKEADSAQAPLLREQHAREEISLCAPQLLVWEVANVLRYKPTQSTSGTLDAVQSLFDMRLHLSPATPALATRAIWIAYEHDVTVYDATFVALAQELQCPFVMADARLVGKIGPTNAQLLSHL